MDREQEVIHQKMEETRSNLTDKLAKLEDQVGGTVQAATEVVQNTTEAVTGTVETVKETVENVTEKFHDTVAGVTDSVQQAVESVKESVDETVRSVAESFNLKLQCERHPWLVFGGAVAAGCVGTLLLSGSRRQSAASAESGFPFQAAGEANTKESQPQASSAPSQTTGEAGVTGWLWDGLKNLRSLALGAMMGSARDLVTQVLPEKLKERVSEEVDKLTKSLGGEPIEGEVFAKDQAQDAEQRTETAETESKERSESSGGRAGRPVLVKNGR